MQQQQRDMNENMENVTGRSRTRGRRVDYASIVNRRAANTNTIEHHTHISSELNEKAAELVEFEKALNTSQEALLALQAKLGPISEEDFMNYAKSKVNCAFEKLDKLFNEDNDIVRTNKALSACKVFDILFLRTRPSIANLKLMIDDLSCFNFPEFTDDFLKNMKAELPSLLDLVTTYEFDFDDKDKESKEYKNRVLSRARRAKKELLCLKWKGICMIMKIMKMRMKFHKILKEN